ncbi:helix-turn-helix transcriptional regulator [Arcicella sp. DC2W]|uniref:Helix-turn-helix transcriptional regulator n=1 Tax=Arcicella gelida TaxID=2984195 RepID=A0ABU5S228_9BACT|nr:helix-turn-helix transcriptional regulator [Arcicella sp. DC2W]MEA5402552.1 helix-turn-helix transcriptional regulator [Arcicella sp. DC2W]
MEKHFLLNIKRIRTEKGISQQEMADKLGFAQNNYSKIERGIVELTVNRLYEIAEILNVSIFEILIEEKAFKGQSNLDTETQQLKEKYNYLESKLENFTLIMDELKERLNTFKKVDSDKKGTTDSQINQ